MHGCLNLRPACTLGGFQSNVGCTVGISKYTGTGVCMACSCTFKVLELHYTALQCRASNPVLANQEYVHLQHKLCGHA